MSNVILFDRRNPETRKIPIQDREEVNRVANQYCLNLATLMRQTYEALGEGMAKAMIDIAHSNALLDHKTDKRSV